MKRDNNGDISLLLERIKSGDREAFVTITRLYQRKVFALAYSFFRNKEDALDIVQETFLRVYQKIELFKKGKNFQNWLLQITKNICIDFYRKRQSKEHHLNERMDISELNIRDPQASETQKNSDINHILSVCINRLSEKQRMVFVLRQYNHLEYSEIAEILNVAIGTVKSLHFKAAQNMRALVNPYMGSPT
ncbi:MAG: RNA polymerase sigma factor [Candidatus Aminicenantes bacterium]|nr:RNA polymerase sigma factor [Candidatus Aminicenantes bacterium]